MDSQLRVGHRGSGRLTYWSYQGCTSCSGIPRLGTVDLLKYLMLKFPTTFSMGIYNCRDSSGGGGLSIHSCGRAIDLGIPLLNGKANTALGDPVVVFLDKYAYEFGIHGQIWNKVRYDLISPKGRVYTGPHPHYDHNHIEQRLEKATTLRFDDYVTIAGPPTPGDDMTPYLAPCSKGDIGIHVSAMQTILSACGFYTGSIDGVYGDGTSAAVLAMRKFRGSSATNGDDFSIYALEQLLASEAIIQTEKYLKAHKVFATAADITNHANIEDAHHDPETSGGVTTEAMAAAIALHAKAKSSATVHPHIHDEGDTGPAK